MHIFHSKTADLEPRVMIGRMEAEIMFYVASKKKLSCLWITRLASSGACAVRSLCSGCESHTAAQYVNDSIFLHPQQPSYELSEARIVFAEII